MLDLTDPTATVLMVVQALRDCGLDAAVYGGLALAAYGEPRETKDADLAVVGQRGKEPSEQGVHDDSLRFATREYSSGGPSY